LWLPGDILLQADKMCMAHSLEAVTPFLHKSVFEAAKIIPSIFNVDKTATKKVFRAVAAKYLPEEAARRKKLGYPVPIRLWLREERFYSMVREAFLSETAAEYFKTDGLLKLLNRHYKGKIDNSRKIWTVYTFLIWHQMFFKEET
jgi:asparagine synthase (glutamine-hydrolysing)